MQQMVLVWGVPTLTFPFCFSATVFMLARHQIPGTFLSLPSSSSPSPFARSHLFFRFSQLFNLISLFFPLSSVCTIGGHSEKRDSQ